MAKVSWSTSIQTAGGPTVSVVQDPVDAEATDRVEISVAPGDVDKVVNLQPGPASGVLLLSIKSNNYGNGTDISYLVSDGATDSAKVTLSGPQVFSGGSVGLFTVDPKILKFSNAGASAADIEIFVARDATP